VFEYELLDGEATVTYRGERHLCEAGGVDEGMAGGRATAVIRRTDGSEEVIKSKLVSTVRRGDRIVVATAGGGGYGAPRQRDPALLREDLKNGKVSLEAARQYYGYRGNV
jgi:N-methylhydantoinase B/oxoprolinase/acetone carboxylase alpha subunit